MTDNELTACIRMISAASRISGFLGTEAGSKIPLGYRDDLNDAIQGLTSIIVAKGKK